MYYFFLRAKLLSVIIIMFILLSLIIVRFIIKINFIVSHPLSCCCNNVAVNVIYHLSRCKTIVIYSFLIFLGKNNIVVSYHKLIL